MPMAVKHDDILKARKGAAAPRQGATDASASDKPDGRLKHAASEATPLWFNWSLWAITTIVALVALVLRASAPHGFQFPITEVSTPGQHTLLADSPFAG